MVQNINKEKITAIRTSKEDRIQNYTDNSYCTIEVGIEEYGIAFAKISFYAGKNFPRNNIFAKKKDTEYTSVISLEQLENGFGEESDWTTRDCLLFTNFSVAKCREWVEEKSTKVRELLKEFENINKFKTGEKMNCVEVYGV